MSLADINPDFIIKQMPYNLRNGCALKLPSANSTYYGINSVLFRACLMWNRLQVSVKQSQSLLDSNLKLKLQEILSVLAQYVGHDFVIR